MIEVQSSYDRYRPLISRDPGRATTWKEQPDGGNETIYNLGSHVIDQAYVLFGKPERVGCRVWDQRGTGLSEAVSCHPSNPDHSQPHRG
jgi:predicted dehydrogenase